MAEEITTEVEASESTVLAVRNEIPAGSGGVPLDRIPYNEQLAQAVAQGTYTKRLGGTDRCIRTIDIPVSGGQVVKAHCWRACVGVGDQRLCPEHDKQSFQPSQSPVRKGRVINSDSIPLTKAEQEDLAKHSLSFAKRGEALPNEARAHPAPEPVTDKSSAEPVHDLKVYLTLDELAGKDILAVLKERLCEALDGLPCHSVRDMKRVVAIQENIAKIAGKSKRGKRNGNSETDTGARG